MSIKAEKTFVRLLPDLDAVEYVIREGMPERVLPTEDLRPVYTWAMDYYRQSRKAPTVDALHDRFTADFFADHDIDLSDEPEESIEWVVETLQANFVRARTAVISKDIVTEVAQAAPEDRVEVLAQNASRLSALVADLTPRVQMVDLREEIVRVIEDHDAAAADGGRFHGLSFGLDQVDAHYGGVKPGEIAVIAAPAKVGKSQMLTYIALKNWERGKVVALNTLENSVDMTTKRIACQALGLDYTELDRGMLSPQDMISLLEWTNDVLLVSDTPLHILQPTARTPYALVQQAAALDAEAILVDQLTFVEGVTPNRNAARHEVVRDIMRAFKVSIQGRNQVPLLMAHQITREGIKAAEKTGSLRMTDLAESSEVERASDLIFALYGSEDMVRSGGIQFQCLAARRVPPRSFDLHWHPAIGGIGVRNIIDPEFLED